jgi:SAM-dependent methyltransferase
MTPSPFDRADQYGAELAEGLRVSGEDQHFFIEGRLAHLRRRLPDGFAPARILDFGCGTGDTTARLATEFPDARVVGVDTAEPALELANTRHGDERVEFRPLSAVDAEPGSFDLVYVNGVFHHIARDDRADHLAALCERLRPGGHLAFFENNPWNPGARIVMRRIPFDRDAEMVSPRQARRLLSAAGFTLESTTSLFWFPRALAPLRRLEAPLARLPLGAQYLVLGRRP